MDNNFCLDLDLPVSIDLSELDRLNAKGIDYTKWQMHELAIDQNLNEFLERYRVRIAHAEAHYTPPNTTTFAHVDGYDGGKVKINYIFGAKGSYMQWFKTKDPNMVAVEKQTTLNTPYFGFELEDLELIYKAEVKQPSMVEVGIPHNVVNCTNEGRWCFCYMIADQHRKQFVDWDDMYRRIRKFVVRPDTTK